MGQAAPFKRTALVVEDDWIQREYIVTLLEESDLRVIQCESAEAALLVLQKTGGCLSLMVTDVNLAGRLDGIELAHFASQKCPNIHVVVTSGHALTRDLPDGALFLPKPFLPLDVLREAERCQHLNAGSRRPSR
jgi:two-component system cell cycle response regulator CpdR